VCGIAGIVSLKPIHFSAWSETVENKLRRRGPDHFDCLVLNSNGVPLADQFSESNIILWHSRLSVIDVSTEANQPMVYNTGVSIVFNGEIYNYIELKDELQSLGYAFTTISDTEVILAAYSHWGIDCFNRFIGMFAIVIIDSRLQHFIIVRDGLGIKPLYYARNGKKFVFSSRLDLSSYLAEYNTLNQSRALHFLKAGFSDYDKETFISNLFSLTPGEIRVFSLETLEELKVSKINYTDNSHVGINRLSHDEKVIALRETLINTVRLHTRTDVGFCSTLSGGLDSTAIAGMLINLGYDKLKLYSYIPELAEISEEKWVDIAGTHFGIPVIKMRYNSSDFWSDFEGFSEQIDGPYNSSSMYSQFKIYEIIRKDSNTVVLDGQGGDEMFGGYIQYIYYRVYELLLAGKLSSLIRMISGSRQTISNSFLAKNITRLLLANKLPFLYQYLRNNQQDEVLKLDYFQKSNCEKLPSFDRNSLMDKLEADRNFQDLPRLLRYADRNSMAWSLESRVPFASQPIQSFVTKLNSEDIIDSNSLTKNLFRSAVEPYIPAEIFNRRDKKGFNSDDKAILTSTEARDFLESLPISTYAFIDKDSLLKVLDCKNNYKIENLWRIFSLLKWLDQNKINL